MKLFLDWAKPDDRVWARRARGNKINREIEKILLVLVSNHDFEFAATDVALHGLNSIYEFGDFHGFKAS